VKLVTPNLPETEVATGIRVRDEADLLRAGARLLRIVRCEAALVTRGEHGMSLFRRDAEVVHIPTAARDVFDVTGAGDTVIATLALASRPGRTSWRRRPWRTSPPAWSSEGGHGLRHPDEVLAAIESAAPDAPRRGGRRAGRRPGCVPPGPRRGPRPPVRCLPPPGETLRRGLTAKALALLPPPPPGDPLPARTVASCRFESGEGDVAEVALTRPVAIAARRELDAWLLRAPSRRARSTCPRASSRWTAPAACARRAATSASTSS